MKVLIHNDGKEKMFSYEARLQGDYVDVTELGETQEEAMEKLKLSVVKIKNSLENLDYSNPVKVDCYGREIK